MEFIKAIINWRKRYKTSDIKKVQITSSGAFYMKSEDLFSSKTESLNLLEKLNKSIIIKINKI